MEGEKADTKAEKAHGGSSRARQAAKPAVSSYDVIGDIAIVDIPEGQEGRAKEIAESIVAVHPRIKTVLEKKSDRFGEYRLRELKPIIGSETETIHTEHGCRFKIDVTKAYFSPREGTERDRVASQVKPGEVVLVMFAGVGPFAIAIAKKQPRVRKVYAVEINPDAVKYMEENVKLNRMSYVVEPVLGDAKVACKGLCGRCGRVVMPLPHEGRKFLETAIKCLRPGGIIHFYYVGPENDMFRIGAHIAKMECEKLGRRCRITGQRRVLPYGPRMHKVCIDFEVE